MFEFFDFLAAFIANICQLILNVFEGIVSFFRTLPRVLEYLLSAVAFLPTPCVVFASASLSIMVLKVILSHGEN